MSEFFPGAVHRIRGIKTNKTQDDTPAAHLPPPYSPFGVVEVFTTTCRSGSTGRTTTVVFCEGHLRAPNRFDHFFALSYDKDLNGVQCGCRMCVSGTKPQQLCAGGSVRSQRLPFPFVLLCGCVFLFWHQELQTAFPRTDTEL